MSVTGEQVVDVAAPLELDVRSSVWALLSVDGALWAGGPGGVASGGDSDWRPFAGAGVTALTRLDDGTVVLGGPEGLARVDGEVLRRGEISGGTYPIAALASLGDAALAGTLGGGVVRSEDSGRTWQPATFGLSNSEVTALARVSGETVLAGTAAGIHRSPNGGRAWRIAAGTAEVCVAALAAVDRRAVAVGEDGNVLCSGDAGTTWERSGSLPTGAIPLAVHLGPDGLLLAGTAAEGIVCSTDGGRTWERTHDDVAFGFIAIDDAIIAGLGSGLARSLDGGRTWHPCGTPPVHDLSRLALVGNELFAWGAVAGIHRIGGDGPEQLPGVPLPLSAVEPSPLGGLTVATPDGLWSLADGRVDQVSRAGAVHLVSYGPDGRGWAAAKDGGLLLRSDDSGESWSEVEAPWGPTEVIALRVLPSGPVAATYDRGRSVVDLWRGSADGWAHSARAQGATPAVAICADPPAAVLGQTWLVDDGAARWVGASGPPGMINRLRGGGDAMLALTDTELAYSTDRGQTWSPQRLPAPMGDILDIELTVDASYALLAGGRLRRLDLG